MVTPSHSVHNVRQSGVVGASVLGRAIRWLLPWRFRWRWATPAFRVLPDVVIVGAQKAGTTSLYAYLTDLPWVLPASRKEVHFFDTCDFDRGLRAYRANFPLRLHVRLASWLRRRTVITGEATPY